MVKVICGMIGSGKTTYALNNKDKRDVILDWDLLKQALDTENQSYIKDIQDMLLKFFYYAKGFDIWYITTVLKQNEMDFFNSIDDVEYIWINTSKEQCLKNIKKRNRNDEVKYINDLENANKIIYKNYFLNYKNIDFKVIDIFN